MMHWVSELTYPLRTTNAMRSSVKYQRQFAPGVSGESVRASLRTSHRSTLLAVKAEKPSGVAPSTDTVESGFDVCGMVMRILPSSPEATSCLTVSVSRRFCLQAQKGGAHSTSSRAIYIFGHSSRPQFAWPKSVNKGAVGAGNY